MSQSIEELERDIAQSRARLDLTIDRIQDRLSVSGIVDDVMQTTRATQFGVVIDHVLEVVRRNPVPVALIALGVGWLVHRMTREPTPYRYRNRALAAEVEEETVPVLNTGQARIYDPDAPTRHPMQDVMETRRDLNARA